MNNTKTCHCISINLVCILKNKQNLMDKYNDDWCQCPICFEIYSIIHRPTTFICGHSVCIDHVSGKNRLEECE